MFLSFYIYVDYSFHNFYELGNYSKENVFQTAWQMVPRGVGTLW